MKSCLRISTLLFSLVLSIQSLSSENMTGKIYPLEGGNKEKLLYTVERNYTEKDGKTEAITIFKDPQGTVVIEERTVLAGTAVLSHAVTQHQLKESGQVTVADKKIVFKYTRDGKEKEATEDAADNFVISVTIVPFMQAHWDDLEKGKKLKIRYAALDRRETVGFDLFKTETLTIDGKKHMVVKMKPSSFIIAAIVNPLHFYFDTETKRLSELKGRTAPMVKDGDRWKDLDAHIYYGYPK